MKISNLRIERKEGYSYLVADVVTKYTNNNKLWFSVPSEFESWLTDEVYDAFLIAALYPAMFYKEEIEIEGGVSPKLYFNLKNYVQSILHSYRPYLTYQDITVSSLKTCSQTANLAGTGFSAGVDSFATFYDRYEKENIPEFKIGALFFFNVGSHGGGGEKARHTFNLRYDLLKSFPKSKNLPYVKMDSNMFDFYLPHWEYDAGILCRASAIMVFQKVISRYYLSSAHSYSELMNNHFLVENVDLASLADTYMNPLLSTEHCDIITDGAQYTRTQKTALIVDYEPAHTMLNVCVNHWAGIDKAANCGICSKCLRTLIALESLNKLDAFAKVFDVDKYRKISWKYKLMITAIYKNDVYMQDNVDFALQHNVNMPSRSIAVLYYFFYRVVRRLKSLFK